MFFDYFSRYAPDQCGLFAIEAGTHPRQCAFPGWAKIEEQHAGMSQQDLVWKVTVKQRGQSVRETARTLLICRAIGLVVL